MTETIYHIHLYKQMLTDIASLRLAKKWKKAGKRNPNNPFNELLPDAKIYFNTLNLKQLEDKITLLKPWREFLRNKLNSSGFFLGEEIETVLPEFIIQVTRIIDLKLEIIGQISKVQDLSTENINPDTINYMIELLKDPNAIALEIQHLKQLRRQIQLNLSEQPEVTSEVKFMPGEAPDDFPRE